MPIEMQQEDGGKFFIVRASGKLTKADYASFVPVFERLTGSLGKLRVLFLLTDFHGWDPSALWQEVKFDVKNFDRIERIATVGDKEWEHRLTMLFHLFTSAPVRYFDLPDADAARFWLEESEVFAAHSSRL